MNWSCLEKKICKRKNIDEIQRLVESCFVIDINAEIKALTKTILQKYSFKLPDAIIAATAIYLDCPLLTADVAFHKVKELTVIHLSFED